MDLQIRVIGHKIQIV